MIFDKKQKKVISIEGMSCEHCASKIESALLKVPNVSSVKVYLKKKEAVVFYKDTVDDMQLKEAPEHLGYTVTGIKEV